MGLLMMAATKAPAQLHLDPVTNPTYRLDFGPLDYVWTGCVYAGGNPPKVLAYLTDITPQSTYRIELFDLATGLVTASYTGTVITTAIGTFANRSVAPVWASRGVGVQVTVLSGSFTLERVTTEAFVYSQTPRCYYEEVAASFYRTTITVVPEPGTLVLAGLGSVLALGVRYQRSRRKRAAPGQRCD